MSKAGRMEEMSEEHRDIVRRFEKEYSQETVIVARSKKGPEYPKRIRVYVDGILTTMPVDMFERMVEMDFFKVVARKPFTDPIHD